LTWAGQALLHELLLGEAGPPLVWLAVICAKYFLHNTITGLVTQLQQILAHEVGVLSRLWLGVNSVQWKACVTGYIKFGNGQAIHLLLTLRLAGAACQPLQTFSDVERDIDEHTPCAAIQVVRSVALRASCARPFVPLRPLPLRPKSAPMAAGVQHATILT